MNLSAGLPESQKNVQGSRWESGQVRSLDTTPESIPAGCGPGSRRPGGGPGSLPAQGNSASPRHSRPACNRPRR